MFLKRLKFFIFLIFSLITFWIGWNSYTYLFSTSSPEILVSGILENDYCKGDISCLIKGYDNYKINNISILLDDKLLVDNQKINKSYFEYPFIIQTKTISDGRHTIQIIAENSTYKRLKNRKKISFYVDNTPLQCEFIKGNEDAKVFQGKTYHLQFRINKEIKDIKVNAFSKCITCVPESKGSLVYECFIPIDCEEIPNEYPINISITDKVENNINLTCRVQVLKFQFKKQAIKLDPEKVKMENKLGLPEKDLEADLLRLSQNSPAEKMWKGIFQSPVTINDEKQITTEFGMIRTTQEKGLYQHKAVDIYNTPKSVVWAPQDGIIVLKNRYAHSGNTVAIDHGCGILSLFYHLDSFANIEVGDRIKKGNPLGTIGKTGYATGYHLHWEMRIMNVAIDPLQWTKIDF